MPANSIDRLGQALRKADPTFSKPFAKKHNALINALTLRRGAIHESLAYVNYLTTRTSL